MKPLRFVVESVTAIRGRHVVFARRLDAGDFRLVDGLWLSGYAVRAFDIPRVLAPDGSIRLDLFAFTLGDEAPNLAPGETVLLTSVARVEDGDT